MSLESKAKIEPPVTMLSIVSVPGGESVEGQLCADADLVADTRDAFAGWKSTGMRAAFSLDTSRIGPMPAGWYWLDFTILAKDRPASRPSLHLFYRGHLNDASFIDLPEPDENGKVCALVLFPHDVAALRFVPIEGPGRFSVCYASLRRISRPEALRRMLFPRGDSLGWGLVLGGLSFAASVFVHGLSAATELLYARYQRRDTRVECDDYSSWVMRYDTLTGDRMAVLEERSARYRDSGPLISLIVPAYQTPERWLRRCIESVIDQVYPHWELCIVDDASPDVRVMEVLREYAALDSRIKIERRDSNGHICAASNSALALASGEYVGLLDHDDELRPHALLEMADVITENPGVKVIYSDEDKLDVEGRRFNPYFKPDWNADLLLSQNYVCHFTVISRELLSGVGGFRVGFEGSQDHDLILRCVRKLRPWEIRHVPKILYHWRAIEGSTALVRDAKDYAADAGWRAVTDYIRDIDARASVEKLPHGHYRVRWPLPDNLPKVSLVVPTRDKVHLLKKCVESLFSITDYPRFEIVVVDNQSSEPDAISYLSALEQRQRVRVLRYDAPFNYSAINNWAVSQCDGEVVGLVNNDIEAINSGWLTEMVSHALREHVGAVGAMLYYPDDRIQHAGVILGLGGVANHAYTGKPKGYPGHGARALVVQNLSAVTGACLVIRREVYEEVGGLDERLEVAFNDVDLCLRLREAGYDNVWTPFAELYHHESASRGLDVDGPGRDRFVREVDFMQSRWGEVLTADPAHNPNLSLDISGGGFAEPPRHACLGQAASGEGRGRRRPS